MMNYLICVIIIFFFLLITTIEIVLGSQKILEKEKES